MRKMNFVPKPHHQVLWHPLADPRQEVHEEDIAAEHVAPPPLVAIHAEQPQPVDFANIGDQLSNLAQCQALFLQGQAELTRMMQRQTCRHHVYFDYFCSHDPMFPRFPPDSE